MGAASSSPAPGPDAAKLVDDYSDAFPDLNRAWPSNSGRTVRVDAHGGMTLGYEELVDPSVPPERLQNVVLIPGTPGCRFFTHPAIQARGFLPGARLLVLERPGIGLSQQYPQASGPAGGNSGGERSDNHGGQCGPSGGVAVSSGGRGVTGGGVPVAAFAPVFDAFCDAVSADRVSVIGYSAGSPYALAAAACCRPGRVERVALLGAMAPPDFPGVFQGMALLFRVGLWACTRAHWFVRWVVSSDADAARRAPRQALRHSFLMYTGASSGDKQALLLPEVERLFLESHLELLARRQESTEVAESLRYAAPWGFALRDVAAPTKVWAGVQDVGSVPAMARRLAAEVPGCELEVLEGRGHLAWAEDDVLDNVVGWLGLPGLGDGARGPVGGDSGKDGDNGTAAATLATA